MDYFNKTGKSLFVYYTTKLFRFNDSTTESVAFIFKVKVTFFNVVHEVTSGKKYPFIYNHIQDIKQCLIAN